MLPSSPSPLFRFECRNKEDSSTRPSDLQMIRSSHQRVSGIMLLVNPKFSSAPVLDSDIQQQSVFFQSSGTPLFVRALPYLRITRLASTQHYIDALHSTYCCCLLPYDLPWTRYSSIHHMIRVNTAIPLLRWPPSFRRCTDVGTSAASDHRLPYLISSCIIYQPLAFVRDWLCDY